MSQTRGEYGSEITNVMSLPSPTPVERSLPSGRSPARLSGTHVGAPVAFPGYELLAEIGRGGMGVVYKARQQNLNRLVALKVILGGPLASGEQKARFRAEAEAAARLRHPNIVQVYDIGEHAGFAYMALELVEGDTLRQWQNGAPVEPRAAARIVVAVARAVQHAHEQGIVHRDIKPANILLAAGSGQQAAGSQEAAPVSSSLPTAHSPPPSLTPKVADFGLAKALGGGADLTASGVACGTPNYMSPEQVKGKPISPAMDVYGLGAVLYELLTGRPPFVGTDANEVMSRIVRVEPVGVRGIVPAVPRDLAVIAARCLEKEPVRRYASARELADDLDRFLAGVSIAARPIGAAQRAWRRSRRNPVAAAFLAFVTGAGVVTAGLVVALARAAVHERAALDDAAAQRGAVEAARDDLRGALTAAEERKRAADASAAAAAARQKEADAARARAEAGLRVARGAIRGARDAARHPRFQEPEFREARLQLITQVRQFRDGVAELTPDTSEWLNDLSDASHYLGFLEYANGNTDGAVAEFVRAAGEAARWARLEPTNPEPASRRAFALVIAGNALVAGGRHREAEARYRESAAAVAAALASMPQAHGLRAQAHEAEERLSNLYRIENRPAQWHAAAARAVERAREAVQAVPVIGAFITLAGAHQAAARAAAAAGHDEEADCRYIQAVVARAVVREGWSPVTPPMMFGYTAAVVEHAEFLAARGHRERAAESFAHAVAVLDEERRRAPLPHADPFATEQAAVMARLAEFRRAKEPAEAERTCDAAVRLAAEVIRRNAGSEPGRRAWVDAVAVRARLYDQTGRHAQAAAEWGLLATDDPNVPARPHHEVTAVRSLLSAKDWRAASAAADALAMKSPPPAVWFDLARVWCGIASAADQPLKADALRKAVACLEACRARGEFDNPDRVKAFAGTEFDAVRDKFDPKKR